MYVDAQSRGVSFSVMLLLDNFGTIGHFEDYLNEQGIPAVNCVHELRPEYQVKGDGHPNAVLSAKYAKCVGDFLARLLDESLERARDAGRTAERELRKR